MKCHRLPAFILAVLVLVAAANVEAAIDLTTYGQTTEQARVARYTNFIASHPGSATRNHTAGYDNNDAYAAGIGNVIPGFYDYVAEPGQNGWDDWYRMADGVVGNTSAEWIDTYQRTGSTAASVDEWIGYRFKRTASITSIVYSDCPTYDGGVFDATPTVEVLLGNPMERGGVWTPVAVTWDTSYSTDFAPDSDSIVTRTYTITPDAPTGQVWGVRLLGSPKLGSTRDLNGWIAFSELQVSGESLIAQAYDLTNNLVWEGTGPFAQPKAIWSHVTQKGNPGHLIDQDVATYDTLYNADGGTAETNWAGVVFGSAKSDVGAVGIIQKMFKNGGWLDPETTVIEYTTDTNLIVNEDGTLDPSTPGAWTAVTGLNMGRWADTEDELGALEGYVTSDDEWGERRRIDQSELMTFDTIDTAITAIRIRGTTWDEWNDDLGADFTSDDPNGFLGMCEFEVFASTGFVPVVLGDTDHDGDVDADDAATLARHWGESGLSDGASVGDFNGDGVVNVADAAILAANWSPQTGESAAVPEPGVLTLIGWGVLMMALRRRRAD